MTMKIYFVSADFRRYNRYKGFGGRVYLQALLVTTLYPPTATSFPSSCFCCKTEKVALRWPAHTHTHPYTRSTTQNNCHNGCAACHQIVVEVFRFHCTLLLAFNALLMVTIANVELLLSHCSVRCVRLLAMTMVTTAIRVL